MFMAVLIQFQVLNQSSFWFGGKLQGAPKTSLLLTTAGL